MTLDYNNLIYVVGIGFFVIWTIYQDIRHYLNHGSILPSKNNVLTKISAAIKEHRERKEG